MKLQIEMYQEQSAHVLWLAGRKSKRKAVKIDAG